MSNLKRFYFKVIINDSYFNIEGQDFLHAKNVLRLKVGDQIIGICGDGFDYISVIDSVEKNNYKCLIKDKLINQAEPSFHIDLFQALLKGEKMDLVVQKCTEIGIKNFYAFSSEYCQIKPNTTRLDRLEKISLESVKQCRRSNPLNISKVLKFDEMIDLLKSYDTIIFAYEKELDRKLSIDLFNKNNRVALIVGSEGGFSELENYAILNAGGISVSLGKRILRAETASISLSSIVANYMELIK